MHQNAIALTDHGNIFGAVDFFVACKERGIKPIIGMEAYVAPESRLIKESKKGDITAYHLTLLAKDQIGYQNLIQLSSRGFLEGFYYKPRIDMEILKLHSKGLICLSGCIYSMLSRTVLSKAEDNIIKAYMGAMFDIFGPDFYVEVQDHGIPEQKIYKEWLLQNKANLFAVASNDVHYIRQKDARAQEALLCIGTGTHIYDEKRMRFPSDQLYLKSEKEMLKLFPKEWVDRTQEIADQCNVEIELHRKTHIHDPEQAFNKLKEECDGRIGNMDKEHRERYEKELAAIKRTGYAEYLLVVADYISYCRSCGIPIGSGRGSSAGSLICYYMGITEIDPITYGLLFERFINVERVEPPDIDVDVSQERRQEVITYLKNEYGEDRCTQIIAFGSLKAKAVIKDVCRVLQLPFLLGERICRIIGEPFEGTIDDIAQMDNIIALLRAHLDQQQLEDFFYIARKLEGRLRHSSTHAAGVVISDVPLTRVIPLCKREDLILSQYDMYTIERLGLLKFDVLGLRTIDVIFETCGYIGAQHQNIPLNDSLTYQSLANGDTFGVFQYEGYGYTKFIKRMRPQNFDHLIALGALFRPGPLDSGMAEDFVNRMHGAKYTSLDPILDDTYGILLYQEQVMHMAVKLAGFTMNEADTLRKAIGKKDKELMDAVLKKFADGMAKHGYDYEFREDIINRIITFARYGWNKAHAVSYALLSYKTAYLKFNYSTPYFCALLNSEIGDNDRVREIMANAVQYKVKIQSPKINISDKKFALHDGIIYGGLLAIKGIGTKACEAIVNERNAHGAFEDATDLRKRIPPKNLNSSMMKALIESKVFDE